MSEVSVKSLAKKYGVSARDIIKELNNQGFDGITGVDDVIDADGLIEHKVGIRALAAGQCETFTIAIEPDNI